MYFDSWLSSPLFFIVVGSFSGIGISSASIPGVAFPLLDALPLAGPPFPLALTFFAVTASSPTCYIIITLMQNSK